MAKLKSHPRVIEGAKRASIRKGLCVAWIKKHRPDVYALIQAAAAQDVPLHRITKLNASDIRLEERVEGAING